VQSAPSHIAFFIRNAGERHNVESITGKKAVVEELLPMLKRLTSPIELDLYVREVGRELDLSTDSVYEALGRYRPKSVAAPVEE
jgi:DNA primase